MTYHEEYDYNKPFDARIWLRIWPYAKRYKKELIIVAALMVLSAAVDIILPLLLSYSIDNFIVPGTTEGLTPFVVISMLFVLIQGVIVLVFVRLAMRTEINLGRDLRRAVFYHLQTLSFSYYNQTPVGYIMARVLSDTRRIGDLVAWGLVDLSWSIIYVVGVFATMFVLNWQLALAVLAVIPLLAVITFWFQNRILRINREVRRVNSNMTGAINEGIGGARTTKTLVIEDQNTRDFAKISGEMYQKTTKMAMLSSVFMPVLTFIGSVATALLIYFGGGMVAGGIVLVGVLSAFINYAVGIFEPIQQIARVYTDFVAAQANIERITALIDREPDVTDTPEVIERYGDAFNPKTENWEPLAGDIEFRDVTFRYPDGGGNILEHFNLKVPAGSCIAIVGETGAGKSTLVNLVCRFFEPTEGEVLIDGRDYRERSQLWLHSHIGYVLQSPHLFSGTVRDNIRYGRLDASDEEIDRAAKLVSADRVIARLDGGMEADVGEGGDRLSTGEKQMISFARAVLADPRIFVLDEATSSIDTETEHLIQNAIAHLLHGRTSLIIAHRLSTIREADLILVVDDGRIIERGTHNELIGQKGHYYSLYTRQFEQEQEADIFQN